MPRQNHSRKLSGLIISLKIFKHALNLNFDLNLNLIMQDRVILEGKKFKFTIDRLCHQLIENHDDFRYSCLIGVQPRGVLFANHIYKKISKILGVSSIRYGKLDVTFYRDDFRIRNKPLIANTTEMDFLVDGQKVILIDDVLYTGRTIRAALDALQHYGRPDKVELLSLVDRRFNRHVPIQSDYTGITVDAVDEAYVAVDWAEKSNGNHKIFLHPKRSSE